MKCKRPEDSKVPPLPTHAVAALGIGACFYKPEIPKSVWVIGAVCSLVPDLDVIGFRFGIHYGDFWGHRGFTHSLLLCSPRVIRRHVGVSTWGDGNASTLHVVCFSFLRPRVTACLTQLPMSVSAWHFSRRSTTTVTFFPGLRFACRQ